MADIENIIERNIERFNAKQLNCAETVLVTMCEYMGVESPLVPRIATPFGGGMAGAQSVCGTVTGGLMAIGICEGREIGGDQMPARKVAGDFMNAFYERCGTLSCMGLTGVNMKDPDEMAKFRAPGGKHHTVCNECVRFACRYLASALEEKK